MKQENIQELNQKRIEYTNYINEHREFVQKAFFNFKKAKLNILTLEELEILEQDVYNHDLSKFSSYEFEAYRKKFFPCSFEINQNIIEDFEMAKKHHYEVNDHHPQHPSRKTGLNKIACVHNILDWVAMSYKFGNDVWHFYETSNIQEKINPEEQVCIKNVLNKLKEKEEIFYKVKEGNYNEYR